MQNQAQVASAPAKNISVPVSSEQVESPVGAFPALSGPDKYSPANILRLQQTVGNQAVMRLLANRPGRATQVQRAALENVRGVIQRKGAGLKAAMKPSAKETVLRSTWFKVTSAYSDYMAATKPEKELKSLQQLEDMLDLWEANHTTASADQEKKGMVVVLRSMITDERRETVARLIGLAPAFRAQLSLAAQDGLVKAANFLEKGNVGQADAILGQIQGMIPGFNLVKSMLLRQYIGSVNPALAGAISDPKFSNSADTATQENAMNYGIGKANGGLTKPGKLYNYYETNVNHINKTKPLPEEEKAKRSEEKKNQMFQKEKLDSMTEPEATNITTYTMGTFNAVNPTLRDGLMGNQGPGKNYEANEHAYTLTTISALNKLKPYLGTVYRHGKLFPGYSEVNLEGAVVNDMGFMSTTYKAESLSDQFGTDTLEIIKSKTGRFIKPISAFAHEDEVLFKPGTRFKITERYTAGLDPNDNNARNWPDDMSPLASGILQKDPFGPRIKVIVIKEEV